MVDLETIIALASMTYIVNLDAYELRPGMKTTLLMNARVLQYTYINISLLFRSIFVYLC